MSNSLIVSILLKYLITKKGNFTRMFLSSDVYAGVYITKSIEEQFSKSQSKKNTVRKQKTFQ